MHSSNQSLASRSPPSAVDNNTTNETTQENAHSIEENTLVLYHAPPTFDTSSPACLTNIAKKQENIHVNVRR
jgi:hypothetical protein